MFKKNKSSTNGKQRYRIIAESVRHWIADFWASDGEQANDIARRLKLKNLRPICSGDIRIDSVRLIDAEDEELYPFKPLN
jgi:hypothetical protein